MKRKKSVYNKLERLKWYPQQIYSSDENGELRLVEDEKADWNRNDIIKNYSGGISTNTENDNRFVQEIENQNWARALLTFQFTNESIKFVFPDQHSILMNQLVKLLVFDAITGNNDRHFYNWAVITHIEGVNPPRFSPIYDSARGLFWNIGEQVIERKYYVKKGKKFEVNSSKLDTYINDSRPKIGWEGWKEEKEINHFQLIANINKYYPQYQNTCKRLMKKVNLQSIFTLLERDFATYYTPKRLTLIKECLKRRFEMLNNLCKSDCND